MNTPTTVTPTRNPNLSFLAEPTTEAIASSSRCSDPWWTGLAPQHGVCPGVDRDGKIHSLPQLDLRNPSRQQILDYFNNTWTLTEVLFSSLKSSEAFVFPPYHGLRHPLIFYYGHPAVLYINKLRLAGVLSAPLHQEFEQIFETGVDEMSWDDLSKNEMSWPSVDLVREYRRKVYQVVVDFILHSPLLAKLPIDREHPAWALAMALEHERIHLETSSVLIRELPISFVETPACWPELAPQSTSTSTNTWLKVAGREVTLGRADEEDTFGWDNEFGHETRSVGGFSATRLLISNREYLEFVKDGGYQNVKFWSSEGWRWRSYRNGKWPTFWMESGPQGLGQFHLRTCFKAIPLPLDWPAIVNFHEAESYCRWLNAKEPEKNACRLMTEAEFQLLCDQHARSATLTFGSEGPVEENADANQLQCLTGNVWQWGEDDFHPLKGFKIHRLYDDFSTPCFDGRHSMIFGGSFMSTGGEAGRFARFHFRRHFFQHAGFRLIRANDLELSSAIQIRPGALQRTDTAPDYESRDQLAQYLFLHYGDLRLTRAQTLGLTSRFPETVARLVGGAIEKYRLKSDRVLDVGCAVGGTSFELTRYFKFVKGLDLSQSFIDTAQTIQSIGQLTYFVQEEGAIQSQMLAEVDSKLHRERVEFRQGDAGSLPLNDVDYDAVLAANLLCRLPSPKAFLQRMSGPRGAVRPGGLLILISPYSWMEQFTPKEVWLGGYLEGGVAKSNGAGVKESLQAEFDLLEKRDVPLVIREHGRKFQLIFSQALIFRRKVRE